MTEQLQIEKELMQMTGLFPGIPMEKLDVRGLTRNSHPMAIALLEHPMLRQIMFNLPFKPLCRRNLAMNSSKEAIRLFAVMVEQQVEKSDISLLCQNPSKPAVMHLMNFQQRYAPYIDWNAVYNNPCELAQWWVSIKIKSTPNFFEIRGCSKNAKEPVAECKEMDLYTLAKRTDKDATVILESFLRGTWLDWFDETSKMKPVVEREWNAAFHDPDFWHILCENCEERIIHMLPHDKIDWEALSSNPAIFQNT